MVTIQLLCMCASSQLKPDRKDCLVLALGLPPCLSPPPPIHLPMPSHLQLYGSPEEWTGGSNPKVTVLP